MGANNDPAVVRKIQSALEAQGIDCGGVDGEFGPKTTAAVAAFQRVKGLVVDGEVGSQTARALEIEL
jgi:peptidoglycan hydrolase-like protein with peptidoglycan-binding domain